MTYSEMYVRITKRRIPGMDFDIEFARRVSWRPEIFVYHGWVSSDRDNETAGLCISTRNGSDYYEPTERDFQADDWTLDIWNEGDRKMGTSYFEVKKQLKLKENCYAYREGWDDEHPTLAYNLVTDTYFLTDFGSEMKWEPTIEDVETNDWTISRFVL